MSINLNHDSVRRVCGNSDQVMVYGFQHCRYTQVSEALKRAGSPIKKVFDCSVGNNQYAPQSILHTLEGDRLEQLHVELDDDDVVRELKQYCKAGLSNLVFENVKRNRAGLPLIKILFVVDIDHNPIPLTAKTIASKEHTFVTLGELRRSYKLCNDPALHPEIRAVASQSFAFVKVKEGLHEFGLELIAPPWEAPDWDAEWAKRKEISAKNPSPQKRYPWRAELNAMMERLDHSERVKAQATQQLVACILVENTVQSSSSSPTQADLAAISKVSGIVTSYLLNT